MTPDPDPLLARARELLDINLAGLRLLQERLDARFAAAVAAIRHRQKAGGKIVVTGVGKSHHVGQKAAATLTSTGSPAVSLHPSEALHGDIGLLQDGDVVLAFSYSGATEELLRFLPFARRGGALVVGVTGRLNSPLAALCDHLIPCEVEREACPFNLAPTTSTLVMLAIGDLLATLLHEDRGFTREAFARLHPAGAIGHTLHLRAGDVMRPAERVACVREDDLVQTAVLAMTRCRAGAVAVVDERERVVGILTDGDLRRHIRAEINIATCRVREIMSTEPVTVAFGATAADVMREFEKHQIDDLILVHPDGRLAGMVDLQDMPKLKMF
jgi:arabinose-5-phosphate isomerase